MPGTRLAVVVEGVTEPDEDARAFRRGVNFGESEPGAVDGSLEAARVCRVEEGMI
jgi:hypothetical protein